MPCIDNLTKNSIIAKIQNADISSIEAQNLAEYINDLPLCNVPETPKGKKGERKLTKYNLFLSPCLRKEKMKQCIVRWNIVKECMKRNNSFESCKAQQGY